MPINLGSGIPLFANHKLEDISYESQNVIQKSGFRQIEIALNSTSRHNNAMNVRTGNGLMTSGWESRLGNR
jgi:hypothetical protein